MRALIFPLLVALLIACSSGQDPPPTPTPRALTEVTAQPAATTAAGATPTATEVASEPTAAPAATQPPAAPTAVPTPSCAQASPQDVADTMQTLNDRIATASPIEQIALRASLSSLDRDSDGQPDPGVCQSTLQAARLVASQPAPSRP